MRSTSARIPLNSDAIVVEILVPISSSFRTSTCWCSWVPCVSRSSDPNSWRSLSISCLRFFSKAVLMPTRKVSDSFVNSSLLVIIVCTVGAVVLFPEISCRDVVGVASAMGGDSPGSDSSRDVVNSSDSSSEGINSNLGGLWSTCWAFVCLATFGVPASFW